ncbi:hypothetical protein NBRC110019_15530 [Neptunitalea chrysea]|uniref:DUF262 domain-containing protein n=1 Tax=Neptunitalea chrysea TaxID=1647581 RepID=A0A9W6B825_9FLAO|nr:DUF262 domain-containing HNH endonuclease family protein [Neptunitalea chrysea]GLB52513.1 hypothetical protein NBRC110019_15530 [Neptunitalea chrysea]
MDSIASNLTDIKSIVAQEYEFNIPIYQRLYVWTEEQVKTLFEDLLTAYKADKDIYYIGGVITVNNENSDKLYDLVDGQQRFTTLWLLSNELGGNLEPFTYKNGELRLKFAIRQNVTDYFNNIGNAEHSSSNDSKDYSDLLKIGKARNQINQLILQHLKDEEEKIKFSNYIFEKVKMVLTDVPKTTDLNKLFEALNNRGEQLAHHEILKARLLNYIKNVEKRNQYAKLWQVCSVMDNYLERVIALEIGSSKDVAHIYHNGFHINDVLNLFESSNPQTTLVLSDVLEHPEQYEDIATSIKDNITHHPESNEDEFEPVRSILSFPQLLLHTLRIFLFENEDDDILRINEKELLETFDKHLLKSEIINEKFVVRFFETLFKVRYSFDRYVIKWITVSEDKEEHGIKDIYKQNQKKGGWTYYLRRLNKDSLNGMALLQSILYHSQQNTTQYWLTPFLYWMIDEKPSFNDAYYWLRQLDNTLFSSNTEHISLPERTINSMEDFLDIECDAETVFGTLENLNNSGVSFPHYWFYKIEFILWYYRGQLDKEDDWGNYKMTARNSIEHIGPQNPRDPRDKVCTESLDTMGNLVLVTRSINSEYSDKAYGVKRSMFENKKAKGSIDSLKSDLIYNEDIWNDEKAKEHFEKIMVLLNDYFHDHNLN